MDEDGSHGGLVIACLSVLQGRVEEAGGIKRNKRELELVIFFYFSYKARMCLQGGV